MAVATRKAFSKLGSSIKDARDEIADIQDETPSLNNAVIESLWDKAFVIAKRDAEAEMGIRSDVQSVL